MSKRPRANSGSPDALSVLDELRRKRVKRKQDSMIMTEEDPNTALNTSKDGNG